MGEDSFVASAPGKILWLGGYSVLEKNNVAYVSVIDKCVFVKAKKTADGAFELHSPQFGINLKGKLEDGKIRIYGADEPQKKKARFILSAAEISLKYLISKNKKIDGLSLAAINDKAFGFENEKTGLGSSAAVTVAVIGSMLGVYGFDIENKKIKQAILNLGFISHSQAQGKIGSGFDIAAATLGNCTYSRFSPGFIERTPKTSGPGFAKWIETEWDGSISYNDPFPSEFMPVIAYTRSSASTSEKVKKINEYKAKYPDYYKSMISAINEANRAALWAKTQIEVLKEEKRLEFRKDLLHLSGPFEEFKNAFDEGRLLTKKLGEMTRAEIESPEMTRLIVDSMKNGAYVCKLPGAGGGDSLAAICLSLRDSAKLKSFWRKKKMKILDVKFGKTGCMAGSENAFRQVQKLAL